LQDFNEILIIFIDFLKIFKCQFIKKIHAAGAEFHVDGQTQRERQVYGRKDGSDKIQSRILQFCERSPKLEFLENT
jgi:hypothetical protein